MRDNHKVQHHYDVGKEYYRRKETWFAHSVRLFSVFNVYGPYAASEGWETQST